MLTTLISREKLAKNLGEKLVKMLRFRFFLVVDNFDFTKKIGKKNLGEKLVKMLGGFVKIDFLDKKLTFRIL